MQTAKRKIAGWLLLMPFIFVIWTAASRTLAQEVGWPMGLLLVAGVAVVAIIIFTSTILGLALLLTDPEDKGDS